MTWEVTLERVSDLDKKLHEDVVSETFAFKDWDGKVRAYKKRVSRPGFEVRALVSLPREVDAMALMRDHAHAVRLVEFDYSGIVFDWYGEGTWETHAGKWSDAKCRAAASHLVSALHHLHSLGWVHRSVAPYNVYVDAKGASRLGDFGSARQKERTMTRDVFDRWYCAESVLASKGQFAEYDERVDVWAAMCSIAELVSGKCQFPGINEKHQLKLVKAREWSVPNNAAALEFVKRRCSDVKFDEMRLLSKIWT